MIIYKVTNLVNGKVYIGQTTNTLRRRKQMHLYQINNNCYFHKALNKYGEDNFKWEIIDNANTLDELNEKEKYYIKYYNSFGSDGYNLTTGGENYTVSESTKEKIRQARYNKNPGAFKIGNTVCKGRKHTEESIEKMRKPMKEEIKQKLRKPKPKDFSHKISKAQLGKKRGPYKTKKSVSN